MSRRGLILLVSMTMAMQTIVAPVFADEQSLEGQSNQTQAADPIVQAQWSALVEAASNAQKPEGSASSYDSNLLPPSPSSGGVDIINESMKYHNSGMQPNGAMQMGQMRNNFNTYGMQNGMNGMNGMGMNGVGMNGMGMNAMGGMNSGVMNPGVSNNFVMPAAGNPMQNQMLQNQMMQNQMMQNQMMQNQMMSNHHGSCQHNHCCSGHGNGTNNMMGNGSGDGLNTQAIGALGAATMLGVFMQKGGVGGILQDIGWDGNRHIRGSSIGGY